MVTPRPPGRPLGPKPKIGSLVDLDLALEELAYLTALKGDLQQQCAAECDRIKERYQEKMVVAVDGLHEPQPIADRLQALLPVVQAYCDEHKEALLDGKAKSRKFTFGTVSWRSKGGGVGYADGHSPRTLLEMLDAKFNLIARCVELLKSLVVSGEGPTARTADQFIDLVPTVSMSRVQQDLDRRQLTVDDLAALGLTVRESTDVFAWKPCEYQVQTETGAKRK
jgi:hypothetical protein